MITHYSNKSLKTNAATVPAVQLKTVKFQKHRHRSAQRNIPGYGTNTASVLKKWSSASCDLENEIKVIITQMRYPPMAYS